MITITYQQDHMPDPIVYTVPQDIEFEDDEKPVIAYLSERYPYMSLDERKSIHVQQNSLNRTNFYLRMTEEYLNELGWAVLFPLGVKHEKPTCPKCHSLIYIKISRNDEGLCVCHCMDCGHESTLTNEEYYVETM